MVSGWTIFAVLVALYVGLAWLLARRSDEDEERLEAIAEGEEAKPPAFDFAGPFLLWRTQRGRDLINRIAKPKRFWRAWGDLAILVTVIAAVLTLVLLLYQGWLFFDQTDRVVENAPEPVLLLGIPGVNPLIPIWYGILALVIALVIHEGSHGILSRVADLHVKALGLVFFIVPIGAFVEPDEHDLQRATTRERNRVFAAGPMSNIALALVAAVVFSSAFVGAVHVVNQGDGVGVGNVLPGGPAAEAGLEPGMVVFAMGPGNALVEVSNVTEFQQAMNGTQPGENLTVKALSDGEVVTTTVTLTSCQAYYEGRGAEPANATACTADEGFLGINLLSLGLIEVFMDVFQDPLAYGVQGVIFYIGYPFLAVFQQMDLLNAPLNEFFVVTGPLAGLDGGFWILANAVYWIFWINLMLGTFNALPAGPLDGGHMFKASLQSLLFRVYGVDEDQVVVGEDEDSNPTVEARDPETKRKLEKVNEVVGRASMAMGLFILALILAPVVLPPIIQALT